jgi:hypothetical protein
LHHKPDDYLRTLQKEVAKSKSSASGKKSASTGASGTKTAISKKSDVPLLGQQAKQTIAPLKVVSQNVPLLAQQPVDMSIAAELAASMEISLDELLGPQLDLLPKMPIAPKYVAGEDLVSKERLRELPTQMRNLHQWYSTVIKQGRIMIVANVPREYYFRPEEVHIEFPELFQLYHLDALDKSILSCYCL